ncbi:mitochondrial inner membrane peptidase complex catalytic subunit [Fimicolochytrium jonesii]|uniref:mitochondrial inner membrane peptidase complex catalytic subunit n=1 Tax=Fimicolochytrium jonesii TaxID=1396493 RepID=UPI0022FF1B6B|nr:mitochondrial inner membrane peptidase complex catalytic subunit [Fimicolochytrium jonesii]KAI8821455.1 mitochondrial inner membrane peptidase complex catalytic subunit [Fimicolochytrium jonesii]
MNVFTSTRVRQMLRYAGWGAQGGCLMLLIQQYVAEVTMSIGPSMLPTFNVAGDLVVVEHVSQYFRALTLGDVVVCVSPYDPRRSICKRVLGLPGDHVCVDPTVPERKYLTVPKGHIWIQGDNYNNSTDSRKYGPVPMGLLRGRVLCKVWPDWEWMKSGVQEVYSSAVAR